MRHRVRLVLGAALTMGLLAATSSPAEAYWSSPGVSGTASATTAKLVSPVVAATGGTDSATVSWTSAGGTGVGYYVTRASTSGGSALAACGTSAAHTVATLSCTDSGVGPGAYTYTVIAVMASWTATGTSAAATITAPTPAQLVFTTQPGNSVAGSALSAQPVVAIEDSTGAVITSNTSTITLTITTPNGATLACVPPSNANAATAGVATFTGCAIAKAGTYTLTATGAGLTAVSTTFVVSPAAASKLVFTTQPIGGYATRPIAGPPTVTVEDPYGNTVPVSVPVAVTVTGSLINLSAGCSATTTAGVATFTNCSVLGLIGSGNYTLTATSAGLTSAVSASFPISLLGPAGLTWTGISSTCTGGSQANTTTLTLTGCTGRTATLSLSLSDLFGNLLGNYTGSAVTITLTVSGTGSAALSTTTLTIPAGATTTSTSVVVTPTVSAGKPVQVTATTTAATGTATATFSS